MKQLKDLFIDYSPLKLKGFPTGFTQFDKATGGLGKELVVIGGLRGTGKTALASQLALEQAKEQSVAFFSMEMPYNQLLTRLIGNIQNCKFKDLVDGNIQVRPESIETLSKLNLFISEESGISPITAKQILLKTKQKFDIIIFDHIGCFRTEGFKGSRYEAIDRICEFLKTMSKELDCTVIILAHLNRESERRENHKPRLSDCREGAGLENFGNKVVLLYKPAFYNLYEERNSGKYDDSEMYFILAKNTNGETGEFPIVWNGKLMKFSSPKWELESEF